MGSLTRTDRPTTRSFTPVPQLVQWLVTHRCPLRCPHCLSAEGKPSRELSIGESCRLIDTLAAQQVPELLITGGEPSAREDLPAVVDELRAAGQRWSLNTALMPPAALRRSMERWPPGFVAVSLDGPAAIHDAFRGHAGAHQEAVQAIRYYGELTGGAVAAGTTITTRNIDCLAETFGEVLASGARTWGLHLLVPEGRAADNRSLFPPAGRLRWLLRFAAAKRRHLEVLLADEIGYCGLWDPLLREAPFACGAGRAQCVILADGEVVPCTTLDRRASAGNVLARSLVDIWRDGFAELRAADAEGGCRSCAHVEACGGGCWLQRRHGRACFRKVWDHPRRSAAAVALWLGLSTALASEGTVLANTPDPRAASQPSLDERRMQAVQWLIISWYAAQLRGPGAPDPVGVRRNAEQVQRTDAGGRYVRDFIAGKRPTGIVERVARIRAGLGSKQRSLCLVGLAWRDLTEWALDGPAPVRRSEAERKALRAGLAELGATAERWRQEILADRLDPYFRRPQSYRHYMITKSGRPLYFRPAAGSVEAHSEKLAHKRGWSRPDLSAELLRQHPHGDSLELELKVLRGEGLRRERAGVAAPVASRFGPFDLLLVPAQPGRRRVRLQLGARGQRFTVELPAEAVELCYADLLRLAKEQSGGALKGLLAQRLSGKRAWDGLPFLLPLLRAQPAGTERVGHWLVDLYLF